VSSLDRDLVAERNDCRSMARAFIEAGFAGMAWPWLRRAAVIHVDLKKRGIV